MKTLFLILCTVFYMQYADGKSARVNAIIGDESFLAKFNRDPFGADEVLRIKTHLSYVEMKLRNADVNHLSKGQTERRMKALNLLRSYWSQGKFPNNYDYPNERRPCFIDKDGNICAVGYLMAETAGLEVAQMINEKHKYEYVMEMKEEILNDWAKENGFTLIECAMIQPQYWGIGYPGETKEMGIRGSYGTASGFLGGANIAVNALNFSKLNASQTKTFARIGLFTGTTQLVLGLANIKKDRPDYSIINMYEPVYRTYKQQNNLSYINIAAGTTTIISSAINLYLNRNGKGRKAVVNLFSQPGINNELNMGISLCKRI